MRYRREVEGDSWDDWMATEEDVLCEKPECCMKDRHPGDCRRGDGERLYYREDENG